MRVLIAVAVASLTLTSTVQAQGWGTIKGKVVFDGVVVPAPAPLAGVIPACLANGPILAEKLVVDPKSRGVRWVMVWIAVENKDAADHAAVPPIHPALQKPDKLDVIVDQPCCKFEPHVFGVRTGQNVIGKNSSALLHNMFFQGRSLNDNKGINPGGQHVWQANLLKPHFLPTTVSCSIHPWMSCRMFVFTHPYYCVTDKDGNFEIKNAPAGNFRLMVWQEENGWVHQGNDKNGQAVTVKNGAVTEVPAIKFK